eukprot:607210-Amphidinium_carterae.7
MARTAASNYTFQSHLSHMVHSQASLMYAQQHENAVVCDHTFNAHAHESFKNAQNYILEGFTRIGVSRQLRHHQRLLQQGHGELLPYVLAWMEVALA